MALGIRKEIAVELAFHIADVAEDFNKMNGIMRGGSKYKPLTKRTLMALHDIWNYHAHYHVINLHRLLRKAVRQWE